MSEQTNAISDEQQVPIPTDLLNRYKLLASYKPMEVAVTEIYVREYMRLIERIAILEAANRQHEERIAALALDVQKETNA